LETRKQGIYQQRVELPKYLKKDGFFPLIIPL